MKGERKVYLNGPSHMAKMAAMPICVKTFKDLHLQNKKSDDLEFWHGLRVYKVYINHEPGLTLTYLMSRSNLILNAFKWGKIEKLNLCQSQYTCAY